jgi:NAD(P)-dependent dehydrogenase (short-subunit alcohol dehydrogenase family)
LISSIEQTTRIYQDGIGGRFCSAWQQYCFRVSGNSKTKERRKKMSNEKKTEKQPEVIERREVLRQMGVAGVVAAGAGLLGQAAAQEDNVAKPLEGKVAIVTGARNNQGRAYSAALAKMGADIVVHYHREETIDEARETARLVEAEGQRAELVLGDLGNLDNVRRMFDTAELSFGRADILVNCAGAIVKRPYAEITDEELARLVNVNVMANLYCIREAAARLADNGRIINIGTSLLAGSAPQYGAYAATKAVVEDLTRMVSKEIGGRGVTINSIQPGPLDNPFFWAAETPESGEFAARLSVAGRLGTEADIVPMVTFLASPEGQWVNGQSLWVNGGYLTR